MTGIGEKHMERKYYTINEETARTAQNINSEITPPEALQAHIKTA